MDGQIKEHKHLFMDGDVEGKLKPEILDKKRIHTPDSLEISMFSMLEWAVDIIINELKIIQQWNIGIFYESEINQGFADASWV